MICGFFLGLSVVAPGVSGSVMAVMMGIYPELIDIASAPFKNFKRNVLYLIPMGIGALIGVVLFVLAFSYLFERFPLQTAVLFIGLILGGLPTIFRNGVKSPGFKKGYIAALVLAFALAAVMGLFVDKSGAAASSVSTWYLCLAGFVAGIVGIIPGMSVSVVLMLMGVYQYILHSAAAFTDDLWGAVLVVAPFLAFFVIGIIAFSNVIKLLFERFESLAYCLVFGFVCGTVVAVFPKTAPQTAGGWVGCAAMLLVGLAISFGFEWLGKRFNPDDAGQSIAETAAE